MRDEVDTALAGLQGDADRAGLPEPAELRAVGTRRRRRRTGLGIALLVVVLAGGLGAGVALRPSGDAATPGVTGGPGTAPTTSPSAPSAPATSPATAVGAVPCAAGDLVSPAYAGTEGAMGSAYLVLAITNAGGDCTLGTPTLWGLSGGKVVKVPQHAEGGGTVTVAAGRVATLSIRTVDGYGGYASGAPQCAHPATYTDLQLEWAPGTPRYHTGSTLTVTCEDATVSAWDVSAPPPCTAENFPRPAAVSPVPGLVGYQITVTNAGRSCLLNAVPTLRYTDSAGRSGEYTVTSPTGPPVTVDPGGKAAVLLSQPPPAACDSPVSYRDVSLTAGPLRLSVPGTLDFPCATGTTLASWTAG